MAINKEKSKLTVKNVFLVLGLLIILSALVIGLDYRNYKVGNRSHLFGTLNTYKQSQTLRFGNLDLKVTSISLKQYPKPQPPAVTDCSGLSNTSPITGSNNTMGTAFGSPRWKCESDLDGYKNGLDLYNNKNALTVYFIYANAGVQPLNLAPYKAQLLANTTLNEGNNIDYPAIHPSWCNGLPSSELLSGGNQNGCFTTEIDKKYTGPLTLQVKSGGKQKDISLNVRQ